MIKKFNEFINESIEFEITERYPIDEGDEDSIEIIEGELTYQGHDIIFKVEHHDDFGYMVDDLTSDDEQFIDDNYDAIKEEIISNLSKKSSGKTTKEDTEEWVAIDTRTGKELGKRKSPIDRGWASEYYDVPKTYIDIKKL